MHLFRLGFSGLSTAAGILAIAGVSTAAIAADWKPNEQLVLVS